MELSPDAHRLNAAHLLETAPSPHEWRTAIDVQPFLRAAEHLVAAGDIDAAVEVLQPTVYDPEAKTSPINKLTGWTEWRQIARVLEMVVVHEAKLQKLSHCLAVRMVLGTAYERLLDYPAALPHLEIALELARELDDPAAETFTLSRQGNIYGQLGKQQQALDLYTIALALARRTANRTGEGMLLNNIGTIYESLGQLRKAITFFEQAWRIAQRNRDSVSENWYVYSITRTLFNMGDYTAALAFAERTLLQAKRIGLLAIQMELQIARADCLWRLGRADEAEKLYEQTLNTCETNGLRGEQVEAYICIAELALERGDRRKAHANIARAESEIALIMETGAQHPELFLPALAMRAKIAQANNNPERATAFYLRMREVALLASTIPYAAEAYIGLADVARCAGQFRTALNHLLHAYMIMAESEHRMHGHTVAALKSLAAAWPDFGEALAATTIINAVTLTLLHAELDL